MASTADLEGQYLLNEHQKFEQKIINHRFPALIVGEDSDGENELQCPWCEQAAPYYSIQVIRFGFSVVTEGGYEIDWDENELWVYLDNEESGLGAVAYLRHSTCANPVSLPDGWYLHDGS